MNANPLAVRLTGIVIVVVAAIAGAMLALTFTSQPGATADATPTTCTGCAVVPGTGGSGGGGTAAVTPPSGAGGNVSPGH